MAAGKNQTKSLAVRVRRKLQHTLFRQKWNIGITHHPAPVVAGLEGERKQCRAMEELCWMQEHRDGFAADPFLVECGDTSSDLMIFYEYLPWREGRGKINRVRFSGEKFGTSTVVLDSPHHLSYPFAMVHDQGWVIVPEHSAAKDVSLYFLDEKRDIRAKNIIGRHMPLVDTTIVRWKDMFWMFATHAGPEDNSALYIYYADSLEGPWAMHQRNPVKRGLANSRPAGQIIYYHGKMFRPAQDCTTHYGSGIVINEIVRLTKDEFEESPVSEIRPIAGSRYDYGLHTISSTEDHTVIDGARMESTIHPRLDWLGRHVRS